MEQKKNGNGDMVYPDLNKHAVSLFEEGAESSSKKDESALKKFARNSKKNESNGGSKKMSKKHIEMLSNFGYFVGDKLDEGAFSTIYHVLYRNQSKRKLDDLVVKFVSTNFVSDKYFRIFVRRELQILPKLKHPYLVRFHSVIKSTSHMYLFMKYEGNGTLEAHVCRKIRLTEYLSSIWFRQITLALQYLHEHHIVHRDLKCANILISKNFNLKVCDFGFSRCFPKKESECICETYCGTLAYVAPEVISKTPYNGKLADIWSLGVILFFMVNGHTPFTFLNQDILLASQKKRKYAITNTSLSEECMGMIRWILHPDPMERLSIKRILEHEWLAKITKKYIERESLKISHANAKLSLASIQPTFSNKQCVTIGTIVKPRLKKKLPKKIDPKYKIIIKKYYKTVRSLKKLRLCRKVFANMNRWRPRAIRPMVRKALSSVDKVLRYKIVQNGFLKCYEKITVPAWFENVRLLLKIIRMKSFKRYIQL